MAEESANAQLVRRTIDLFNEKRIDEAIATGTESFEMDWSNSIGPLKGVYTGPERLRELWRTFLEAWEEVRWDVQEVIEVDESRLIVVNRVHMRGVGSGAEVEATGVQLWTLASGRPERVKLYQSKAEALEAV